MTTTEPRLALEPAVAEPDPGLPIRPRLRHDAHFADTGDTGPEPPVDEAPRSRFSAQLNYVDDAVRRFLDFRSTRVLVHGEGAALGLLHNGLIAVTFTAAAYCAESRDRDI